MSEFKDLKMILAKDIVKTPEMVKGLTGKVRTIIDLSASMGGITFDNMEKAMNIMAANGWSPKAMAVMVIPVAIISTPIFMHCFVIMEKKE
jgi:hypothetical protein